MKKLTKLTMVAAFFLAALMTSNVAKAQVNSQRNYAEELATHMIKTLNQNLSQNLKLTEKQQAELKTLYMNQHNADNEFWKKNKDNKAIMNEYNIKSRNEYDAITKKVLTEEQYKTYKENTTKTLKFTNQQGEQITIEVSKNASSVTYAYDNERQLKKIDSIQQGSVVNMVIFWTEKSGFSKIVFTDPVKYEPTLEEIKNGQYAFTVKPERTTTYKYIMYYKDNRKPYVGERLIKVFDKNGKEIK